MVRGRVSVGQGTPLGAWSSVHTSYFLQSHWPPLALASCALALFCAPFFVFTHVDGVATQEGRAG